jgi:hypothetical protein
MKMTMKKITICRIGIVLVASGWIGSCASTSGAPTFSQLLSTAEAADDAIVLAATATLNSGAITSAQAKKVLTITDGVNTALSLANTAYAGGNTASATSQIVAATATLTTVQACLSAAQAKASIDTCLAPVSTP